MILIRKKLCVIRGFLFYCQNQKLPPKRKEHISFLYKALEKDSFFLQGRFSFPKTKWENRRNDMNFVDAAKKNANLTTTENGAIALCSTGDSVLNLFASIGGLRGASHSRMNTLFQEAYKENPDLAVKTLFYARDIRGGLGEREVFRILIRKLAELNKDSLVKNIPFIGLYGRFDDLYALIGTSCEKEMWNVMKDQFVLDLENYKANQSISLLAKWIKTPDASSKETRKLGILTSQKLGYPNVAAFKKDLRALRRYLELPEIKMSANQWDTICYEKVASNCMNRFSRVFRSHDEERFNAYMEDVKAGKQEIKASVLYPYDITLKYLLGVETDNDVMEAQWKALPDYIDGDENVLVVADVSGSMSFNNGKKPMATSIGLALYFAERNQGEFHNLFMTFSKNPHFVTVKGDTLREKIHYAEHEDWDTSTNLDSVFQEVLSLSKRNNVAANDLPKAIVVISDMQIDSGFRNRIDETFYEHWKSEFEKEGYEIPNVVFWNVNATSDVFHFDKNMKGVQAYSGSSASTFKSILKSFHCTPIEAMLEVLGNERYSPIVA